MKTVIRATSLFSAKAQALAEQLGFPLVTSDDDVSEAAFMLEYRPEGLGLQDLSKPRMAPLCIDYKNAELLYRQRYSFRGEGLARALGLKRGEPVSIIDATAGLGRDAALMAAWGCSVRMIERSPIMAALLADALERAPLLRDKLTLIVADARDYLQQLEPVEQPDMIYLDPMFPASGHRAAPKKEMQILRSLLGGGEDPEGLLAIALRCAKKRVVLKRHRLDQAVGHYRPSYQWKGQSIRFDIFLCTGRTNE